MTNVNNNASVDVAGSALAKAIARKHGHYRSTFFDMYMLVPLAFSRGGERERDKPIHVIKFPPVVPMLPCDGPRKGGAWSVNRFTFVIIHIHHAVTRLFPSVRRPSRKTQVFSSCWLLS